jgi:endonuclease YncB( thermonuclease family)
MGCVWGKVCGEGEKQKGKSNKPKSLQDAINLLHQSDFTQVPLFSFSKKQVVARVVGVHDGDTITIGFDQFLVQCCDARDGKHCFDAQMYDEAACQPKWVTFQMRMLGFDSPELHPRKNEPTRELEASAAIAARDALAAQILHQCVWVEFAPRQDKFGRQLGTIYALSKDGSRRININQWMIDHHLGKPFSGKEKKQPWTSAELKSMVHHPPT